MLIRTVVAPLLGTNTVVVADDDGTCVVVDPGGGVVEELLAVVHDAGLTPVALLATHGHVDHTWSAGALASAWGVPLVLHEADAYRLADPFGTLGPLGSQLAGLAAPLGGPPDPPRDVRTFSAGGELRTLVDLPLPRGVVALPSPGHTEGSTVYLLEPADGDGAGVALTGDVLFRGTIGRTDLPGGDAATMRASLHRLRELPGSTVVIPGHGETTTVAAELATNPYLRG